MAGVVISKASLTKGLWKAKQLLQRNPVRLHLECLQLEVP